MEKLKKTGAHHQKGRNINSIPQKTEMLELVNIDATELLFLCSVTHRKMVERMRKQREYLS